MRHQRFVHLNRGRVIQQECKLGPAFAELNIARRLQNRFHDPLAIDERSVGAVEIVEPVIGSLLAYLEMMDGYGGTINQRHVILRTAADASN